MPVHSVGTPHLKSKARSSVKTFNNYEDSGGFHQDSHSVSRNKYRGSLNPAMDDDDNNRSKRERSGLEEMVVSIKYLGEGFLRMERAKMAMEQKMEDGRMEMEMKLNEMLLESQKQIVDAFVKGLFEMKKNKKMKDGLEVDSAQP